MPSPRGKPQGACQVRAGARRCASSTPGEAKDASGLSEDLMFSVAALVSLMPAAVFGWRREAARNGLFWILIAVAVAGPLAWSVAQMSGTWRTGFSTTLWVTIAVTMAVFAGLAAVSRHAWQLTPLLAPYMLTIGALAIVWQQAPMKPLAPGGEGWIGVHIAFSVLTYSLVTLAAIAALAAFLQERALKAKSPSALTRRLPAVADCEFLLVRLLVAGESVLALGLLTGMAVSYRETGAFLVFDHKTLFTITAFVVIGALLWAHFLTGVRGRVAARLVLLAYLLLTLGYPGVKFVTDVVMS